MPKRRPPAAFAVLGRPAKAAKAAREASAILFFISPPKGGFAYETKRRGGLFILFRPGENSLHHDDHRAHIAFVAGGWTAQHGGDSRPEHQAGVHQHLPASQPAHAHPQTAP